MPKSLKFLFCRRLGKFNVNCINYTSNVNITVHLIHRHCLKEAHLPCTCELWSRWMEKIAEMLPKIPTTEGC